LTNPATISGTATADDVVGPTGQGIAPGEFDEVLDAIRAGVTYANVHSSTFGGGEIRAQLADD
jgi:CHRD domain